VSDGSFLQQLQQIGSAFGPVAAGAVGVLVRTVNRVATGVEEAKKAAEEAKKAAEAAAHAAQEGDKSSKTGVASAVTSFEAVSRAMRMELDGFKQEVEQKLRQGIDGVPPVLVSALARFRRDVVEPLEDRLVTIETTLKNFDRLRRSSRPEFSNEEETTGRYQGLSSTLLHEQGERRALQETLSAHMQDEAQRWMTLERTLGKFEGLIGTWENDRKAIETQIQSVRSEVHTLLQTWRSR
jgi:hypothetical protein